MGVPVNELSNGAKYEFYRRLRNKILNGNAGRMPARLLMEWDEVRLKLNPKAPQLYTEVTNGERKDNG